MNCMKILLLMILLVSSVREVIAQDEGATNEYYIDYMGLGSHENKYNMTLICMSSNDGIKVGEMQEDIWFLGRELGREKERTKIESRKVFWFKIRSGLAVGGSGLLLVGAGMIATGNATLEKPGYTLIATGSAFVMVSFAI